jgi:CBS domain-containing protein
LLWLGPINIVLGIFNLIPGFPLDGGRVLRSILWAATDSLHRATRWASLIGQVIAWAFIGAGISMIFGAEIPFLGTGLVSGLWIILIGWFLQTSSTRSYRSLQIRTMLEDVRVSRLMRRDPPVVPPDCVVEDLIHEHIIGTDDHGFPVVEGDNLVGLVTLEDVRAIGRQAWGTTTVRDIMTPVDQVVTVDHDAEGAEALDKLQENDVHQLPVMREGELAGLLRRRDLLKWIHVQDDVDLRR